MLVDVLIISLILLIVVVVGSVTMLLLTIADKLLDMFCGFTMTEVIINLFDTIIERT